MKNLQTIGIACVSVAFFACEAGSVDANLQYRNALTGEECAPDLDTFVPTSSSAGLNSNKPEKEEGLPKNPTGIPGDNMDDASSGRTDCLGDGNSGHGDDKKHPCPPAPEPDPGCDAEGCCEVPSDDDGEDDGADDGGADDDGADDDGANDGGADDGSGDEPSGPQSTPQDEPSCDHLDDECGYGAYEPDTSSCVYEPSGACDTPAG